MRKDVKENKRVTFVLAIALCIGVMMNACNEEKNIPEQKEKSKEEHLEISTVESVNGNYRVDIPKEFLNMKYDSSIIGTDKKLQAQSYSSMSEIKGSALLISSAHYSDTRFAINSRDEILEQSGSELLKTLQASAIRYSKIKHGGFDGAEMRFTTMQHDTTYYGRARVFVKTPTIYYLTFLSNDSMYLHKKEVLHFFSSLRALR